MKIETIRNVMKFRIVCTEKVSTEFTVQISNREKLGEWLEKEGADTVSYFLERQVVHERNFDIYEGVPGKRLTDVFVDDSLKQVGDSLIDDKEGFADRVNEAHGRLVAQIQARPTGNDVRKIITETPSMKAEDPKVVIQNCYIKAREGDENFHLRSPLVIDNYAIIPREMLISIAEILREVS